MGIDRVIGYFEGANEEDYLSGWAHADPFTGGKLELDVLVDGEVRHRVLADQYRDDLRAAGVADPASAFWVPLGALLAPNETHSVSVQVAGTGLVLAGSPREVAYGAPAAVAPEELERNLLPNAHFLNWPHGVVVPATRRFTPLAEGWFLDFRKGTQPEVAASIEQVTGVGGAGRAFGMRIALAAFPAGGYVRLVVPLSRDVRPGLYRLGLGLRPSGEAASGALGVRELFLASLKKSSLERIATIKRAFVPRATVRLRDQAVPIGREVLDALDPEASLAFAIDFQGTGELVLFDPTLARVSGRRDLGAELPGRFEDGNIQNQSALLKLSPLWEPSATVAFTPAGPRAYPKRGAPASVATPFTAIVIPVFNAAADVEECVASIQACTGSPFAVLLADDASDDFTRLRLEMIAARDPRVTVLRAEVNQGYTRNINRALQSTVADHVVLLNSDTVVTPDWLGKLHEALAASEDTAAAGPVSNAASWQSVPHTKAPSGDWAVNRLSGDVSVDGYARYVAELSAAEFPEFPLLNGFCTLFKRAALERVGYFADEVFPQGYGEENDLCLRLGQAGYTLRVADHCYVFHKKSKSFGNERRKELSRASGLRLRDRHPTVSFPALEERMRTSPPLNLLRQRLLERVGVELEHFAPLGEAQGAPEPAGAA